jgi:uncharacterized membrane protein
MDAGQVGGAIAGIICAGVAAFVVCLLVGAVILRAACSLYNKLAGPDKRVSEPGFGKAMGIMVVTLIVNVVVGGLLGLLLAGGGAAAGADQRSLQLLVNVVSIPVGFLTMAGMLTVMLPTSFGRALLVTLLQYAIMIAIGIVVGLVIFVVVLALGIGFAAR